MTAETRDPDPPRTAPDGPRVAGLALWILVGLLVVAGLAATAAVIESVRSLAGSYLAPPPLASASWVRGILAAAARERAFGLAVPALITAAGVGAVLAGGAVAVRRGLRIASGWWLGVPAAAGIALLLGASAALRAPVQPESLGSNGVTGLLFSAEARGGLGVAAGLGVSGMLVLAAVAGRLAVDSGRVLIAAAVVAVALGVAVVPAIAAAVQPIDDVLRAPSYPAQSLVADPHASALANIAGTGAGAFAVAVAVAGAIRLRRRRTLHSSVHTTID